MSSQSASSHVVTAAVRPVPVSLGATIRRIASLLWHSYERHSLYQVMLASGEDGEADDLALRARRGGQH